MKTTYLLLMLLLGLQLTVSAQILTPDQLQSDFDLFHTALQEVHPQMYRYTPKPAFDSLFAVTKACLNKPMTKHEFYKTMLPLLAALRDGHVKWIPAGSDQHYPFFTENLFPLKLYFIGEKAWISGDYGSGDIPIGSEIISINGKKTDAIINFLLPNITFADGYTINGKYEDLNHFFSGYYATHFGPSEEFEVVYLENNKEKTARLKAVTEKTIKAYVEANKPVSQKPFRLVMNDSRTAVMTIERFWDNKKEQNYKNFLKESFRQLKKQGVQNLVLDVRSNEGGNENYGVLLYSYLSRKPFRYYDHIKVARKEKPSFNAWTPKIYTKVIRKFMLKKTDKGYVFTFSKGLKTTKPKKNAYDGELYILINGSSFSVTTEFSARVHADGRATFIGQETGGGYRTNSSGMFTIVQLPHSKIDLGIPMFGFHMADIPPHITEGQGIQPDTVIVPGVQDILQQKDPVLEYTLQLIQENSSAAKQAAGVSPKK